ncbi:MAG: CoA transferase subunit A [Lachnospiraceae bacterium]
MIDKSITYSEVVCQVSDGSRIMIGGFGAHGYPDGLIKKLEKDTAVERLELYLNAPNQYTRPELEALIAGRCKRLTCSYMLYSNGAKQMYYDGRLNLLPQGTFAESIRAGGMGIPAYYTSIGVGTEIETGKEKKVINGKEYILEEAMTGDFAFLKADIVDKNGNCFIKGANKNFSVLMALACEKVFVEAERLVEVGEIDPELVSIPGVLVTGIVEVEEYNGSDS